MKLLRLLFPVLGDMQDTMSGPVPVAPRLTVVPVKPAAGDPRYVGSIPLEQYMALGTGITRDDLLNAVSQVETWDTPYLTENTGPR